MTAARAFLLGAGAIDPRGVEGRTIHRCPWSCPVCGQLLPVPGPCPNRWCARDDRFFSVVFSAGVLSGQLAAAVSAYKDRGELRFAPVFARMLAAKLERHSTWFEEFDLLVAMPCYTDAGARRQWDPVGLVLSELRSLVCPAWDIEPRAVVKLRETPPMRGRRRRERLAIAAGPLRAALSVPEPRVVSGARVLVVDDVFTEGSSLREVAAALRRAGAGEVAGLVLARPPWDLHTEHGGTQGLGRAGSRGRDWDCARQ